MGQIVIRLLSDSCISSGEAYNSSIDSDVCYDNYGLPFIPAKRIRGCLREAALELRDFGMDIDVDELFGQAGNRRAAFTLGNAKLRDYESYVEQLESCAREEYKHRQTVLDQFTYVRRKTGIERVTGTAEEASLQTIRVMKKGLEFVADIKVHPEYGKKLALCCKNLRSMGKNRNRGMGEVCVTFLSDDREKSHIVHAEWNEGTAYERLDYTIRLKAPMLAKSVAGGQTKTVPYIEGAMILGLLAQELGGEGLMELNKKGRLICANAYISDGGVRYAPVSASLYGIKNEKKAVRDKACRAAVERGNREGRQLVQLDGSYVDSDTADEIRRLTVDTEIRFHHSRPQDKSVGHVIGNNINPEEGGSYYQTESIAEGQEFSGYILGNTEQLKTIYDILVSDPVKHLGYGKASEYGETEVAVTALRIGEEAEQLCSSFVVKLNAPAILYNENGMYAADEKSLTEYIAAAVKEKNRLPKLPKLKIENRFLKYGVVGGFHTMWGLHKPVINALDAGTTLVLEVEGGDGSAVDIGRLKNVFLGERVSEGYGEVVFYPVPAKYEKEFKAPETTGRQAGEDKDAGEGTLIRGIATKRAHSYLRERARQRAAAILEKEQNAEKWNPVVANLLLMCEQQETYTGFQANIEDRFHKNSDAKGAKLELAKRITPDDPSMNDEETGKPSMEKMEREKTEAERKYPEADLKLDEVYKVYMTALLIALKYILLGGGE